MSKTTVVVRCEYPESGQPLEELIRSCFSTFLKKERSEPAALRAVQQDLRR